MCFFIKSERKIPDFFYRHFSKFEIYNFVKTFPPELMKNAPFFNFFLVEKIPQVRFFIKFAF